MTFRRAGSFAAALIGTIGVAQAQAPQRTTATFEDWTVRCEMQGNPPVKTCEMAQSATAQGQATPIAQVAIGRATKSDPVRVVFQVPVNVWLPVGLKFVYDDKEQGLAASFKRCAPIGCFADTELKDDLLKKLRARPTPGYFEFKDAAQRDVKIPVSFKGFGLAFDALAKE